MARGPWPVARADSEKWEEKGTDELEPVEEILNPFFEDIDK